MLRIDLPPDNNTILTIWSFKRKRSPDGRIQNYKTRICAYGGMETWGENYWETYAYVVSWLSIITVLTLSMIHSLQAISTDFTLTFPQVDLDLDFYIELPPGFNMGDSSGSHIIKLNKSLYGLCQSSHNWCNFLRSSLEVRAYDNNSATAPCVFIGKASIVIVYIDDCIILSRR